MGHIRMGRLPRTRKWAKVVAMLQSDAPVDALAGAAADAAETALARASADPIVGEALWLLVSLPLVARAPDFGVALAELGLDVPEGPSLLDLTASVSERLDRVSADSSERSDLGEMARMALVESLVHAVEPELPSLFEPDASEVRTALGRLSGGDRFAGLARDFMSRLTQRSLDYYLSRVLADHVGDGRRFATDAERQAFDAALALHCREATRIVEAYAGGWYGKTVWQGAGLTREASQRFGQYAFKKIRDELGQRRDAA